ncbi:TfoX/Sxy family protein [Flavobacterium ustbae]|uniref:TfoX/Sxy family protein n=1 Tax=Flavobacterium ustbae TaxID=2488790 RepID=UPI000F76FD84|nr:TfoX/Sxy family protein [Flavobacterium ustbae]
MYNTVSQMPNIGDTLANKLIEAEIHDPSELRALGTENAFIKVKTIDPTACINMLYALEGAIQNIRWHNLDKNRKAELREFEKRLNK